VVLLQTLTLCSYDPMRTNSHEHDKLPHVSVIITMFEQPQSLDLLLIALMAQDYNRSFEVIICDDGSASGTVAKCITRMRSLSIDVRYIWQPDFRNRASRSKNNGIRCARGKYLVFLDADIVVDQTFLRDHVDAHTAPNLIVCNPRMWVLGQGSRGVDGLTDLGIADLLATLRSSSVDRERAYQQRCFLSKLQWLTVIGFSFSVPNVPEVMFDEHFVGWGPEDRELALRLVAEHNFSVVYRDDIEVFHLEPYSTGRQSILSAENSITLPTEHKAIESYLLNIVYLADLHATQELGDLLLPLLLYKIDSATNRWFIRSPQPLPSGEHELKALLADTLISVKTALQMNNE
jgi:glycosyltransferase involved in cell wall biosynthesis